MARLGHINNYYIFIYRTAKGLKAVVMTEERFVEAIQAPGHHLTEVERLQDNNVFNVAYPREWEEADAHYLIVTQISTWPIFKDGVIIQEAEGGIGGPEAVKTESLPF